MANVNGEQGYILVLACNRMHNPPQDAPDIVQSHDLTGADSADLVSAEVIVVDEGNAQYGVASHIAAMIAERAFYSLDAPVRCIAARNVPIPFSPVLEDQTVPTVELVADAVRRPVRGEEI